MDIARDRLQVGAAVQQDGFEAALEQVAAETVATVVVRGVGDVEPLHGLAQIRVGGLQDQVVMVGHQAVAMDLHAVLLDQLRQV